MNRLFIADNPTPHRCAIHQINLSLTIMAGLRRFYTLLGVYADITVFLREIVPD